MSHVDSTSPITHVSLCAGYGGIDLGLSRAIPTLRTIAFSEIEGFACANLVSKMEAGLLDPAPIWTDLKTFPWAEFHGRVDILSGGYPCQPFSAAGKRLGAEDPRHLWPHISAGIAAMRPSVCFFENVEGHISLGLPDVIEDLAGMGYRTTWCVASASECGAPHQRKRIFILAECSSQRGASGLSRSLAGHEGFAGISDDCGGEGCGELAESSPQHAQGGINGMLWRKDSKHGIPREHRGSCLPVGVWPSRPGEQQFAWEPPRVVANHHSPHAGHGEQRPERTSRDLSGGCGEAMGNAPQRQDHGREPGDVGIEAGEGRCGDHAVGSAGEGLGNAQGQRPAAQRAEHEGFGGQLCAASAGSQGAMGHANGPRPQERSRQRGSAIQGADADGGEAAERQAQPSLGRDADGLTHRLDDAVLHVSTDNRTDELRLLGNGVVPATAERAFRVLVGELRQLDNA